MFVMPQLQKPTSRHNTRRTEGHTPFLEITSADKWVGQSASTKWPPRSPDHTPLDLHFQGCVKNNVPLLPQSLRELRDIMSDAIISDDEDVLRRMWDETALRRDVCRITSGKNITHLRTKT